MNLLTATPRSPYLNAYLALLPGCALGAVALLVYALAFGPGAVDVGKFAIASILVFIWFGYALALGACLVTLYCLPVIWFLLRMRVAGPALMVLTAVLPGLALLALGSVEYRTFSWYLLGFGGSVGLSFCALAYRGPAPGDG